MIRYPAARKLAENLLHASIVHLPLSDAIIDMAARQIMLAVSMDEQRQRTEQIMRDLNSKSPNSKNPNNKT